MLFNRRALEGIAAGRIDRAFRRWRRPTVKTGGTLRTAIGTLGIDSVELISEDAIHTTEAKAAGFPDREALRQSLGIRDGQLYRICFHLAGQDGRIGLRDTMPNTTDLRIIVEKLRSMDAGNEWTHATLNVIADRPGRSASELEALLGLDRDKFKRNVRKLKELGLTESLMVGYRLSRRGAEVLRRCNTP